jgi:hypothetical protein
LQDFELDSRVYAREYGEVLGSIIIR